MKVEGLSTPLMSLRNNKKKMDGSCQRMQSENVAAHATGDSESATSASQLETGAKDNEPALKAILSNAAFARLKGLHLKALQELVDLSHKYYVEVALPKLGVQLNSSLPFNVTSSNNIMYMNCSTTILGSHRPLLAAAAHHSS